MIRASQSPALNREDTGALGLGHIVGVGALHVAYVIFMSAVFMAKFSFELLTRRTVVANSVPGVHALGDGARGTLDSGASDLLG